MRLGAGRDGIELGLDTLHNEDGRERLTAYLFREYINLPLQPTMRCSAHDEFMMAEKLCYVRDAALARLTKRIKVSLRAS